MIYFNSKITFLTKGIIIILFNIFFTDSLFSQEIIPARKGTKWGYIDLWGNVAIPFVFDDAMCFEMANTAKVKIGNKWGYINKAGMAVVPCRYEEMLDVYTDHLIVAKKNKKWGVLDYQSGKVVIPIQFDTIITGYYNDKLFISKQNNKFSAYRNGKEILPPDYDALNITHDGHIIAQRRGRWGIIDSSGQILIPIKYKKIEDRYYYYKNKYSYCYKLTSEWDKVHYLDIVTLKMIPDSIVSSKYREGLKVVSLHDSDVYLNREGKNTIGKKFHTARPFQEGIAMITNFDLSRQCIDTWGDVIFDVPKGMGIANFCNRWALCHYDSLPRLEGLINRNGKIIIEPHYNQIKNILSKKHFRAIKGDHKILYDTLGQVLNYSEIGEFCDDICTANLNGKWGVAGSSFREVIPPVYDSIVIANKNLFAACKNGKWGFINDSENIKIPFIYESVNIPYEGLSIVRYKKKYGIIDLQNRCRVKFEYDEIRRFTGIDLHEHNLIFHEGYLPDRIY